MRDGPEDQNNKDEMKFRNTKYKAMRFWNNSNNFSSKLEFYQVVMIEGKTL